MSIVAAAIVNGAIINLMWPLLLQRLVEICGSVKRQKPLINVTGQGEAELAIAKGFVAAITI